MDIDNFLKLNNDPGRVLRQIEENKAYTFGYANVLYKNLIDQIAEFEKRLRSDEEIGAYLASFGKEILVSIEKVRYHNPYFIIFDSLPDTF